MSDLNLSYHQRGLFRGVLSGSVQRPSDLSHTQRRSLRSEVGSRYVTKGADGRLFVNHAGRKALGVETCYVCMADFMGADLDELDGGPVCTPCKQRREQMEAECQRAADERMQPFGELDEGARFRFNCFVWRKLPFEGPVVGKAQRMYEEHGGELHVMSPSLPPASFSPAVVVEALDAEVAA